MVKAIQVGLGHWGFSWSKDVIPKVPTIEMVGYVDTSPTKRRRGAQTELGIDPKLCLQASMRPPSIPTRVLGHLHPAHRGALSGRETLPRTWLQRHRRKALHHNHCPGQGTGGPRARRWASVLMVSQNYRHQPAPIMAPPSWSAPQYVRCRSTWCRSISAVTGRARAIAIGTCLIRCWPICRSTTLT